MLGTVGKPLARRDAWALSRGIWTYGGKVIEFQSFSMNKKIRKYLLLTFCVWQRHMGTLVKKRGAVMDILEANFCLALHPQVPVVSIVVV